MALLFEDQVPAGVHGAPGRLEAIGAPDAHRVEIARHTLVQSAVRIGHLARVETGAQLLADSLLVQLELSDLGEDVVEVLEENVGLLAVQNVVVADDGAGLHAELRLGEDEEGLSCLIILIDC